MANRRIPGGCGLCAENMAVNSLSCPKTTNHKYFFTQGRRVFERPANWDVRLRP